MVFKGGEKGVRALFRNAGSAVITLPNEYSIEINDPTYGRLTYDAKVGLMGSLSPRDRRRLATTPWSFTLRACLVRALHLSPIGMHVKLMISGGLVYAGDLGHPMVLDSQKLGASDAERLEKLVAAAHFFELPSARSRFRPAARFAKPRPHDRERRANPLGALDRPGGGADAARFDRVREATDRRAELGVAAGAGARAFALAQAALDAGARDQLVEMTHLSVFGLVLMQKGEGMQLEEREPIVPGEPLHHSLAAEARKVDADGVLFD